MGWYSGDARCSVSPLQQTTKGMDSVAGASGNTTAGSCSDNQTADWYVPRDALQYIEESPAARESVATPLESK